MAVAPAITRCNGKCACAVPTGTRGTYTYSTHHHYPSIVNHLIIGNRFLPLASVIDRRMAIKSVTSTVTSYRQIITKLLQFMQIDFFLLPCLSTSLEPELARLNLLCVRYTGKLKRVDQTLLQRNHPLLDPFMAIVR